MQTITGGGTSGIFTINGGTLTNVNLLMTSSNVIFAGTASAVNASITNISNVNMNNSSTLANATVTKNGGVLNFLDTSSGGQASVTLMTTSGQTGQLQFSNYTAPGTTIGSLAGSGTVNLTDISNAQNKSLTIGGNNQSTTFSGQIIGGGSIVKEGSGTLTLTGNNTYAGGTTINAGTLAVNGSLASGVNVLGGGNLGGTGTIGGNVIVNGAISPGNSIGTLNITGNYIQNAGSTYQVEVGFPKRPHKHYRQRHHQWRHGGRAGRGRRARYDLHHRYGHGRRHRHLPGLTSNLAFVTPSLSYDANNVFLTLRTSFAGGGGTGNEIEVGGALDQISDAATGDLDTVVTVLANLDRQQGLRALDAISGQP